MPPETGASLDAGDSTEWQPTAALAKKASIVRGTALSLYAQNQDYRRSLFVVSFVRTVILLALIFVSPLANAQLQTVGWRSLVLVVMYGAFDLLVARTRAVHARREIKDFLKNRPGKFAIETELQAALSNAPVPERPSEQSERSPSRQTAAEREG